MVSVIIPLYNNEEYIDACLQSVVNQSYKDIEIIIVNDGSKDNSLNIVEKYADRDNRIKIISKENGGRSSARNTGLKYSIGEFLMFVDADDELEKDSIKKLYDAINKYNSDISVGAISVKYDTHLELKNNDSWYFSIRYSGFYDVTDKLIEDINCSTCGKIFRRSIIDKNNLQFPDGINYEDAYWHWVYITSCRNISCIKDVVYKYYRRKNSIMSLLFDKKEKNAIDHIYIVEKIYEFWNNNNNLEKHKNTALSLLETYFWLSIKYSESYKRADIASNTTRIARKYDLNSKKNIFIDNVYNGNYSFLFREKENDNINYFLFIRIMSIINSLLPKYSKRRKIAYFLARYIYRLLKSLNI